MKKLANNRSKHFLHVKKQLGSIKTYSGHDDWKSKHSKMIDKDKDNMVKKMAMLEKEVSFFVGHYMTKQKVSMLRQENSILKTQLDDYRIMHTRHKNLFSC